MILLAVFRQLLTSKSAFSTFKHHFRGGQNRFSTSGGHFQTRNVYFWTSKTRIWSSKTRIWSSKPVYGLRKPIYGVYLAGGFAPRTPLWRLRRASCWCEGVLNTGGARPAPAKCAYPPARPAKCAFPSLLVVLFSVWLLYAKNQRPAPPVITSFPRFDFSCRLTMKNK